MSTMREVIENAQYNLRTAFRLGLVSDLVSMALSQLDTVVLALERNKELDDEISPQYKPGLPPQRR